MRPVTFVAVLATIGAGEARAQDAAAGEKVFGVCKACHQIGENAKNAVGPVLNGVIGRMAGSVAGYSYSDANKSSGITWDDATFGENITDPKVKVPGTKMIYPGLKDDRRAVILSHFSTSSMLMGRRNRIMRPAYGPPRSRASGVPIERDLR